MFIHFQSQVIQKLHIKTDLYPLLQFQPVKTDVNISFKENLREKLKIQISISKRITYFLRIFEAISNSVVSATIV